MKSIIHHIMSKLDFKGLYKNVGGTTSGYTKDMYEWTLNLEHQGRIRSRWCILNNHIHVLGNVDMRGVTLKYPFGVIQGHFLCDPSELNSENYPYYIANLKK